MIRAQFKLVNIGESKFNGTIEVDSVVSLFKEVRKHVSSQRVEIDRDTGTVLVGLYRPCGRVEPLNDDARRLLKPEVV